MERVILDTGVLIACARGDYALADLIGVGDAALPAIGVAEYLVGVELSTNEGRRVELRRLLTEVVALAPVIDYTARIAEHHAVLLAGTRRSGRPRGAFDLIIAATARATERTILTFDARARFDELPGVDARVVMP